MLRAIAQLAPALAILVAVALRRAERRLVARLRAAGATSAERAIALEPLRAVSAFRLRRMARRGAVRRAAAGHYYLDEPGYAAYRQARRRRAMAVIGAALAAALAVYVWQARAR